MKTFKIICITAALVMAVIGCTKYQPIQKENQSQQLVIDSLNKEVSTLKVKNEILLEDLALMIKYYCSTENLLDTIYTNFTIDGVFVFEYEPYYQISNEIFEYEELYNFLEEERKKL